VIKIPFALLKILIPPLSTPSPGTIDTLFWLDHDHLHLLKKLPRMAIYTQHTLLSLFYYMYYLSFHPVHRDVTPTYFFQVRTVAPVLLSFSYVAT
jgi:hypothetical protein